MLVYSSKITFNVLCFIEPYNKAVIFDKITYIVKHEHRLNRPHSSTVKSALRPTFLFFVASLLEVADSTPKCITV